MKCADHDCEKEAVKGCYCQKHWDEVQAEPDPMHEELQVADPDKCP